MSMLRYSYTYGAAILPLSHLGLSALPLSLTEHNTASPITTPAVADKMDTGASGEELVGKKKTNGSIIWRQFGFKVSDEQQNNVFCRECQKSVPTKSLSTTNLFRYLQQRHKVEYEECVKLRAVSQTTKSSQVPAAKQTTLQNSYTRAVPHDRKSEKWEGTKAVAYHIAKDMVPISTVEQEGFIQLLKTLDRRYQLPSRKYFTREALPKMYTEVRETLTAQLTKVSHFTLTTDMWSRRPYMSVTMQFMEDWELKIACLQTSYFFKTTPENIQLKPYRMSSKPGSSTQRDWLL
ncbi:unnamed protein product [Oreochromis niloticus]|nr:unnamed protein product [Mustela putorius furo]